MKTTLLRNAIIAGIAGTLLFDLFGWMIMGQWWDIPTLLSEKMGLGLFAGVISHYVNGIALAILFTMISTHLFGPQWLRPFIFISIQTIVIVWFFMFPMLGAGIGGVKMGIMTPIASLMRHWVYVLPFIFLIKPVNEKNTSK